MLQYLPSIAALSLIIACGSSTVEAEANQGALSAIIVGSGSPHDNPDHAGPAVLIRYGSTLILVDTGNGTQAHLDELDIAIRELDGLFFTHHHLDHNEEFIPIFIRSLLGGNDFRTIGPPPMQAMAETTLDHYGEDIAYRLRRSGRALDDVAENHQVTEIAGGERFSLGEIEVSTAAVNHTIAATAYRFDAGGRSIVISGDLTYSESLSELAEDSDVLIIDSGAVRKTGEQERGGRGGPRDRDGGNRQTSRQSAVDVIQRQRAHVTLAESARMASEAGTARLVLTHFTPGTIDEAATTAELRKRYDGEIVYATDLMTVSAHASNADHASDAHDAAAHSHIPVARPAAADDKREETRSNPCTVTPGVANAVSISEEQDVRRIRANAIPAHKIGTFPTPGNPNTVSAQDKTYTVPLSPEIQDQPTFVYDGGIDRGRPAYVWGVALNGVKIEPSANEFFEGPSGPNPDWPLEALSDEVYLGEDCNNAHVQPNGEYHYHGTPTGLIDQLTDGRAPTSMVLAGWAADGFPIYYRIGPKEPDDIDSELITLQPSYALRTGQRPGNGETAPDGAYSGLYVRDYAYSLGLGDLDRCNGRQGVTPEFPYGTYYYVLTETFPFAGRCLVGKPGDDFETGGGAHRSPIRQAGGRPDAAAIMTRMDRNADGMIDRDEARGRLQTNFERRDRNADGTVTSDELSPSRR